MVEKRVSVLEIYLLEWADSGVWERKYETNLLHHVFFVCNRGWNKPNGWVSSYIFGREERVNRRDLRPIRYQKVSLKHLLHKISFTEW